MDDAGLQARLMATGAVTTVSIDTNISRSSRIMVELLELAGALKGMEFGVRLVVSAPALAEIIMDLRQRFGDRYAPEMIADFIEGNDYLEIEAFTRADAEHQAERLTRLFADDASWQSAKVDAALADLKLAHRDDIDRSKARCSATIDWLIGSQAERGGWLLATHDKGPEFADLDRVSLERLRRALHTLSASRRGDVASEEPPSGL